MSKIFNKFLVFFFLPAIFLSFQNIPEQNNTSATYIKKQEVSDTSKIIIDSNCSLKEALSGMTIPPGIKRLLAIVDIYYYSFDHKIHKGQIVINKDLINDIKEIFNKIKEEKFPIEKVIPIYRYNWSDEASAEDNNTSAFNYRRVKGTKILSNHASGKAIDINPKLNPQIKNNKIFPDDASYSPKVPGTISPGSFLVKTFLVKGWKWGGNWKHLKDYQHFEK